MKFTATHKKYNNFQPCSPQGKAHEAATIESNPECFYVAQYFVSGAKLYRKTPKLVIGVVNQSVKGGKWEQVNLGRRDSIESFLARAGAVQSDFKGAPKV